MENGTRVKFIKQIYIPATGDHPDMIAADIGDTGTIDHHGTLYEYYVSLDSCKDCIIGVDGSEIQPINPTDK